MTTADSRILSRFPFEFIMACSLRVPAMKPRSSLAGNSTIGPFRSVLRGLAYFSAVQIGAVLEVPRMRGHGHIGHPKKTSSNDRGNLEAIKVLVLHLGQNPLQRALYLFRP